MKKLILTLVIGTAFASTAFCQELSETQSERLRTLNKELQLETQQLFTIGQLLQNEEQTEKEIQNKIEALKQQLEESKSATKLRIVSVLSEEQAEKYRELETVPESE